MIWCRIKIRFWVELGSEFDLGLILRHCIAFSCIFNLLLLFFGLFIKACFYSFAASGKHSQNATSYSTVSLTSNVMVFEALPFLSRIRIIIDIHAFDNRHIFGQAARL